MPVSSIFALLRGLRLGYIKRPHRFQPGFLFDAAGKHPKHSRPDAHSSGRTFS